MGPVAYSYDKNGLYIGPVTCQPDKVRVGKMLLPRNATFEKPPAQVDGRCIYWANERWEYREMPRVPEVIESHVDVIKAAEIRENPELLSQMISNERMIMAVELGKRIDEAKIEMSRVISGLNSRLVVLENVVNGVRAVVDDLANDKANLKMVVDQTAGAIDGLVRELSGLSAVALDSVSRVEYVEKNIEGIRAKVDGPQPEPVAGVEVSVADAKPTWWKPWA